MWGRSMVWEFRVYRFRDMGLGFRVGRSMVWEFPKNGEYLIFGVLRIRILLFGVLY